MFVDCLAITMVLIQKIHVNCKLVVNVIAGFTASFATAMKIDIIFEESTLND